jgi:hypothetical protein
MPGTYQVTVRQFREEQPGEVRARGAGLAADSAR